MNAERDKIKEEIELGEDTRALDYAVRRSLSIKRIFDRAEITAGFYDVPEGVIEGNYARMISHGLVNQCFPEMPQGDLWEEAEKLSGWFSQVKAGLLLNMNKTNSRYPEAERKAVRDFKIDDVVDLADAAFKRLNKSRPGTGGLVLDPDANALYWLRIRSIGMAALTVASEYGDPALE